ncbi:MAG: prepilin-type N-terminal cleavage/methylation domain-containing protein [Candidatus Sumerlaeia bacterium]|nr:prepilin-type N-terminal cleavage/methylation domain-containing protein [Candidatus Sumerlaeia bacterium]
MRSPRKSAGFTLIELLIVVTIIAILAAIAVPNFLEAQVRSKVARAKNDLRVLATALEAYHVDNNNYPFIQADGGPGIEWQAPFGRPPGYDGTGPAPAGLTTPIAYLTARIARSLRLGIRSGRSLQSLREDISVL